MKARTIGQGTGGEARGVVFDYILRLVLFFGLMAGPLFAAKPPEWTLVKTPHFTVLTTGKPAEAQGWATDLERFRIALGMILPVDKMRLEPVTVVIFPNAKQFTPYKQLQHGKPAAVDGYFARSDNANVIGLARDVVDPSRMRQIVFHEATHWYSSAREDLLPTWVDEGMAEVFSTFTADEKSYLAGDAIPDHVRYLKAVEVPPIETLVGTAREKIDYNDEDRTGRFYAGSWLLVHWIMYSEKGPGEGSLARYLALMKAGQAPEAAFTTAFGADYKTVRKRLTAYIHGGRYFRHTLKLPAEPLVISPPRKASEAEVEYALGTLLLGAQRPQDGLPHLMRAVKLDDPNPAAWEAVGFTQFRLGNKVDALAAFSRAIETGSKTALVWYNRAALKQEIEYEGGSTMKTTDPADFGRDAADFRQAIKLDPRCQQAYQGLAGLVYSVEPADPDDARRLAAGQALFPEDRWIRAGQIMLRLRAGAPGAMGELKTLLQDGSALPISVRQLIGDIIEQAKLKLVAQQMERLQSERRYAELVAVFDVALGDEDITTPNKQELRRLRDEVDRMRRLQEAVDAINGGRHDEGVAMLRKLQEDIPPGGPMRRETERLLKAAE